MNASRLMKICAALTLVFAITALLQGGGGGAGTAVPVGPSTAVVATSAADAVAAAEAAAAPAAEVPPVAPAAGRAIFVKLAIAAAILTLIIGLVGKETRPRTMLRFLASLCGLIAALAIIADWSRPPGTQARTLLDHLSDAMPTFVAGLKTSVTSKIGSAAWDPVLTSVLANPAWLVFLVLALGLGYAGRPRRRVRIFTN